jgi:hypothetical protein
MKKQKHIPFKKPFYKLLGVSVLSLGLLYGGLVWAFDLSGAQNCVYDSTQCVGVAPVGNGSQSSSVSGILQDGETLEITNTGGSAQFVPLRSATERTSLFQAKNAGNEKLGELDICQPGLGSTIPSVFGNGIMGCDTCTPACVGSWTSGGGSCTGGTYTNGSGSNYCQKINHSSGDPLGNDTEIGENHCASETNSSDCNSSDNQYLSHIGTYFSCTWGGGASTGSCSSLGQSACGGQSGCNWNTGGGTTYNCNIQESESSCESYNSACSWSDCSGNSCITGAVCTNNSQCGTGGTCAISNGSCGGNYISSGGGSTPSCSGNPTETTKLDWDGDAYAWEYGYVYYLNNSGNAQIASICGADAEVGDSIGSGIGSYPNNSNQCIIQTDPLNGTYYQVHQFSPGVNYWFALTTVKSQVTTVTQMPQFGLGNTNQNCNGTSQSSCLSVSGCTWAATNNSYIAQTDSQSFNTKFTNFFPRVNASHGPYYPNCFVADTQVILADGSNKDIQFSHTFKIQNLVDSATSAE